MSHSVLLDEHILGFLPDDLNDIVMLDVGCGFGEWGFLVRTRKRGSLYIIGLDIWHPYLEKIHPLKIYDELIVAAVQYVPLRKKSVDISVACEILEHLQRTQGHKLLKEVEKITRRMVVVSTPLDSRQGEIRGNPYERHRCNWQLKDFTQYGYEAKLITLSKTLDVLYRIGRVALKLPPRPRLIVARKRLT